MALSKGHDVVVVDNDKDLITIDGDDENEIEIVDGMSASTQSFILSFVLYSVLLCNSSNP